MVDRAQDTAAIEVHASDNEYHSEEHHDRRNIIDLNKSVLQRSLTGPQRMTLNIYQGYGWELYVRNAKSNSPIVFIASPDRRNVLLIDEDGDLIEEHDIVYRH